jgi:hypothetical protein
MKLSIDRQFLEDIRRILDSAADAVDAGNPIAAECDSAVVALDRMLGEAE